MAVPNLLASKWGRLIAFFFLYVTEGIPLGFTATAIATQLRRSGVGVEEIGFFVGWLYFPWGWKWVMGPIVDLFFSERLGARRGWILGTQIMMVLTLLCCLPIELTQANLKLLTAIILIHNFMCATQDVAIDALACNTLRDEERGLANGLMFAGQTLGIPVGGACVLYLIDGINVPWLPMLQQGIPFEQTYFFVAGCIFLVTLLIAIPMRENPLPRPVIDELRLRELETELAAMRAPAEIPVGLEHLPEAVRSIVTPVRNIGVSFLSNFLPRHVSSPGELARVKLGDYVLTAAKSFFGSRVAFAALILALLPAGAAALNLALQKTLAVEIGMTDSEIADLEVVSSIIWAIACVCGGLISDRVGHLKSLAVFLVLMSIPTVWLAGRLADLNVVMPAPPPAQASSPAVGSGKSSEQIASGSTAQASDGEEKPKEQSNRKTPPPVRTERQQEIFETFWWGVMFYMIAQGLMYGTRTAVFMQISNPAVAATQFTAYMAMMNLVTTYTAWWQGVAIGKWGYPVTLYIDAGTGLIGLILLPLLFRRRENPSDPVVVNE